MRLSKDGIMDLLRLTEKGQAEGRIGQASVSKIVWPLVDAVPADLLSRTQNEGGGGVASLTEEARTLLKWDAYFATCPKRSTP